MPRKSKDDQYQKLLDPQTVELLNGGKKEYTGKKHTGRPKKENVSASSPFLGRVAATGKITKNNFKKKLEEDYAAEGIKYLLESTKDDDFQKDLEYDYSLANQGLGDQEDLKIQTKINNFSEERLDKYLAEQDNSFKKIINNSEKDQLGFGIQNNQAFNGQPFDLGLGQVLKEEKTSSLIEIPKANFSLEQLDRLGNLKYIISDILSGDTEALNDPTFKTLGLANVKLAIEYLLNNQGLTSSGMKGLIEEPWRLVYRRRPPTMQEFLTEEYVGPDSETLYPWVRRMLIEGFDPATPHRNLIWYYFIGGGKSTASVMSNLYISLCNSLMWHQYKFYGHAQPLDSKVLMADGTYKEMGDIEVGDKVLNPENPDEPSTVLEIRPQGTCKTYEVELEDGSKAQFHENHICRATYRKDDEGNDIWETVQLKEIMQHPERDWYFETF